MSAVDAPATNPQLSNHPPENRFEIRSSVRLHAVFTEFLRAYDYARDLHTDVWDFAIEFPCLRRLNATKSDLRWLVATGFVDHAIETTAVGDAARSFKRPPRVLFSKRTCFTLTTQGAAKCSEIWGSENDVIKRSAPPMSDPPLLSIVAPTHRAPTWDRERLELRVGSIVVKRFRVPAASQEAILAAFEEESWPARIDDPLPPRRDQSPKRRLQETIKSLNRNQRNPLIRFSGDGNAQGVLWELVGEKNQTRR